MSNEPASAIGPAGQRSGRGAPHFAGVAVAQKDRLAGRIGDGIVRKRRQPVLAAVLRPRERGAGRADHGPEVRIGDHIGPGQRRLAIPVEHDDVFTTVRREPARAVLEQERRNLDGTRGRRREPELHGRQGIADLVQPRRGPIELRREAAEISADDDASHRREQVAIRLRHPFAPEQKHSARDAVPRRPPRLLDDGGQNRLRLVEVLGGVFVEDDEVGPQTLEPPVLLRVQQLPDERNRFGFGDPYRARSADRRRSQSPRDSC